MVSIADRITVMDVELERCALCDDRTSVARVRVISDGEPRTIAVCQRHFADMLRKIEAKRYGQDVVRDEAPTPANPLALAYLFGL